jgi:hypothetical protein
MKKLLALSIMLLLLSWTPSLSQGIQIKQESSDEFTFTAEGSYASIDSVMPRWRKEAVVKDLIRLDECDSVSTILQSEIVSQKQIINKYIGNEVIYKKLIMKYDSTIIPSYNNALGLYNKENKALKAQNSRLKTGLIGAGLAVLAILIFK